MLTAVDNTAQRVSTTHQAKLAYYLCPAVHDRPGPPAPGEHPAAISLVDRAAALGWPRERVAVIDDDLGKSGTSSVERHDFSA